MIYPKKAFAFLFFSALLFIPPFLFPQQYQDSESPNIRIDPEWIAANKAIDFIWAYDVIVDKDGNSYRTGYFKKALGVKDGEDIHPENSSLGDIYFLIKSNNKGQIIWYRYAIGNSRPCKLNFDNEGYIYAVGSVFSKELILTSSNNKTVNVDKPNDYNSGIFICKYDTAGKIVKSKFYSEGYGEFANDFKIDENNNIYIGGYYTYRSFDQPSYQRYSNLIFKLDSNWNTVWNQKGDTIGTASIASLFIDKSGNLLVSGGYVKNLLIGKSRYEGHHSDTRPFLAKYDENGNIKWVKDSFDDIISGSVATFVCDKKNNAYLWISTSYSRFYFVKLNKNGKIQWTQTGQGRMSNYLEKAVIDDESSIYLCGEGYGALFPSLGNEQFSYKTVGSTDFFITKYNSDGELQWLKTGGGKATDYCKSIALSGNNLYAFGWTDHEMKFNQKSISISGKCFWLAKFDQEKLAFISKEQQ